MSIERKKLMIWLCRLEAIFRFPLRIAWLIRSYYLIFASNLASTIIQQPPKSAIS